MVVFLWENGDYYFYREDFGVFVSSVLGKVEWVGVCRWKYR